MLFYYSTTLTNKLFILLLSQFMASNFSKSELSDLLRACIDRLWKNSFIASLDIVLSPPKWIFLRQLKIIHKLVLLCLQSWIFVQFRRWNNVARLDKTRGLSSWNNSKIVNRRKSPNSKEKSIESVDNLLCIAFIF